VVFGTGEPGSRSGWHFSWHMGGGTSSYLKKILCAAAKHRGLQQVARELPACGLR